MFRFRILQASAALVLSFASANANAQIKSEATDSLVRYGDTQVARYRVGAEVTARRGAVRDVLAIVAVPLSCPEQEVTLVEEDISDYVRSHEYRMLAGDGARQMMIRVPRLPNKAEAHAILTFEVRTRTILPPGDTSSLVIPKKPPRELKRYLGKSPYIETNNSKFKRLAREIFAQLEQPSADPADESQDESQDESHDAGEPVAVDAEQLQVSTATPITDWQRVEAIYDHVQGAVEYIEGPDKSALATLKDASGDCQAISALFVALCRTCDIPARIVWVHEHNYPEFCLADAEGNLHWFPCESSGSRAFGEMPLARVIMQKGDNFKVPERRKALRYASDYMIGLPGGPGSGPPGHKFIREQL